MRIRKVRLCNFSSYAGDNSIDLETKEEKNVILIGGNNGAGKTSLFTAIKLALYGPQCFKYQDKNFHYYGRIRELINHDAYLFDTVTAFVELEIILPTERRLSVYQIHRGWTVRDRHLDEEYYVIQDGSKLNSKDLDFFQNYLYNIVPPNLFDFFFFDGEEVGEFFSTGSYNKYIKNAVLTLSGYDTFSLIRKFCRSFIATEEDNEAYENAAIEAQNAEEERTALEACINEIQNQRETISDSIAKQVGNRDALNSKFQSAGGISKEERSSLVQQQIKVDAEKSEKSKYIRDFIEGFMPIYITRDLAEIAYAKINKEHELQTYQAIVSALSPKTLGSIIDRLSESRIKDGEKFARELAEEIARSVLPKTGIDEGMTIHDLSREQEGVFIALITQLRHFSKEEIINVCSDKERLSIEYDAISKKLREALPEVDAAAYYETIAQISKSIESYNNMLKDLEREQLEKTEQLSRQTAYCERLRKALQALARNQTAYLYTEKISHIMEELIQSITIEKFKEIEAHTIEMFKSIIRKENYIQLFELDEEFNINLYKEQTYTVRELGQLVNNSGMEALENRLGDAGIEKATKLLGLYSKEALRSYLTSLGRRGQISISDDQRLQLYNKLEISQLSRGEKQVFILSLYWAIIKSSRQNIPFIIDTPFARIDTEHRGRISCKFFPDISDQVIVLSTDEEVVEEYYEAIKPFIAKEYILEYIPEDSKTIIKEGYFGEA